MGVNAVIVAAGEGRRMGQPVPKVYLPLCGEPVILHTLRRFAATQAVEWIIVVVAEADLARCEAVIRSDAELSRRCVVLQPGGATRQASVRQGLMRLKDDCEIVVVHDGARPLVSTGLIERCIEAARQSGAAVAGLPARDTIKTVSQDGRVCETVPRERFWLIQTPQAFEVKLIRAAHEAARRRGREASDDATLVEWLGAPVAVVPGDPYNIKITVPLDLLVAEALVEKNLAAL
ncbi:MAG TPA: 2-C-methyl-D-erythritol 4-phosphate cytidylyltransferase [Candidatus Acidoferrales bacterium]|nr:2-C-methyl-D-erythritol 4-phosphate cytidylyltransferase [Candidatus Acidoferrales bacterium]